MGSITADCSRQYTAAHHSGTRPTAAIKWVVIHCTEGDTAAGAASWFQNPASKGSAHLCVDDKVCYRTLRNDQIPWGATGANTLGFHIEITGYARWTPAQWAARDLTLRRAAYKTALHARLFDLPLRWVAKDGLLAGRDGVTTHAEVWKAFPNDDKHTDPGSNFPKTLFLQYAKAYATHLDSL